MIFHLKHYWLVLFPVDERPVVGIDTKEHTTTMDDILSVLAVCIAILNTLIISVITVMRRRKNKGNPMDVHKGISVGLPMTSPPPTRPSMLFRSAGSINSFDSIATNQSFSSTSPLNIF